MKKSNVKEMGMRETVILSIYPFIAVIFDRNLNPYCL